jgi:hypothetical protein
MKQITTSIILLAFAMQLIACDKCGNYDNDNFQIKSVSVKQDATIGATIWEITVKGQAGITTPTPNGELNGAPVLGYVFPTSLKPSDVGFSETEGIVTLALTSHPDFDDTPLWDENSDNDYAKDGKIWHPHWVVLVKDERVNGGFSVKQFEKDDSTVKLPPTNPGMPMFMDSPGFQVVTQGNTIRVIVPNYRMNNQIDFKFDAVTAYMQVNTSNKQMPMLGVYKVYSVTSGNLSLPYSVK